MARKRRDKATQKKVSAAQIFDKLKICGKRRTPVLATVCALASILASVVALSMIASGRGAFAVYSDGAGHYGPWEPAKALKRAIDGFDGAGVNYDAVPSATALAAFLAFLLSALHLLAKSIFALCVGVPGKPRALGLSFADSASSVPTIGEGPGESSDVGAEAPARPDSGVRSVVFRFGFLSVFALLCAFTTLTGILQMNGEGIDKLGAFLARSDKAGLRAGTTAYFMLILPLATLIAGSFAYEREKKPAGIKSPRPPKRRRR